MDQVDRPLSAGDLAILQIGRDFEKLVASPAWQRLLDWLNNRADAAMTANKLCVSSDIAVITAKKRDWACADAVFIDVQKHVYSSIEAKRDLVNRLLECGMNPAQLEVALSALPAPIV